MKSAEIELGGTYRRSGLLADLKEGERTVIEFRRDANGRQVVGYLGRNGERRVYLKNFAKWAEVRVQPRSKP